MKKSCIFAWSFIGYLFFCGANTIANTPDMGKGIIKIINFPRYEQIKEYNCGPAALLTIANFYKGSSEYPLTFELEQRIENEVGTVAKATPDLPAGTPPERMKAWLISKGFHADLEFKHLENEIGLKKIRKSIAQGVPCIIAWEAWGGHWATIIGYDDKGSASVKDDVLLFADPFDKYLGPPAWRTLITLSHKKSIKEIPVLAPGENIGGRHLDTMTRCN